MQTTLKGSNLIRIRTFKMMYNSAHFVFFQINYKNATDEIAQIQKKVLYLQEEVEL